LPFGKHGPAFVQALQSLPSQDEKVAWEAKTVSSYSPGPVTDDEVLVRCCDQPLHLDVAGVLKPAAFSDVEDIGLSVNRAALVSSDAVLWAAADRRIENAQARRALDGKALQPRKAMALVKWTAATVRQGCSSDGARLCGAYDTGKADDLSHADIVALRADKQAARAARELLFQQAKDRLVQRPAALLTPQDKPAL
jgi:hypothetical protein